MAEIDDLFRQITEQNRAMVRYTRVRMLGTWLCLGTLAVLTSLALIALSRNAETDLQQTEDIARVADSTAQQASDDTEEITAYLKGEQGIPGVPGANGQDGTPGQPSSKPGPAGVQGPPGDPGDPGSPGSSGASGTTGPSGPTGAFGAIGPVGPTGAKGEIGETGEAGAQGAAGPAGKDGTDGAAGPTGAQGPPGVPGEPGPPFVPRTATSVGTSVRDDSARKVASATCPAGFVSGGGYAIDPSDPGLIVTASAPLGTNGWSVTVERLSLPAGTQWQVLVFAVCVT